MHISLLSQWISLAWHVYRTTACISTLDLLTLEEKQGIQCFDDHKVESVRREHISTEAKNIGSGNCDRLHHTYYS